MRILLTGGMGFAGGYITQYLVNKGYDVTATYRGYNPKKNVIGAHYVKQDLSTNISIDGRFDAIVHTACSRPTINVTTEDYISSNIDSARQLVKFAQTNGINNIIYFSTRSIYGEVRQSVADESVDIINPDIYGMTKLLAEKIFSEATDINTIGFRTPGIIGPGAHDIWLATITKKIMNNENVVVSDFNTKNMVYIKDIAAFIDHLLRYSKDGAKYKYPVVNLACSQSINNLEIAKLIKDKTFSSSLITSKKPDDGLFIMNAEKAFEMGFVPSSPEHIVEEYVDSVLEGC